VGIVVLILILDRGAFGSLHIAFTLRAVYVVQTILALPFVIALTPAAIQGLAPGLLGQARALGAGRVQLAVFALREAKIGVLAAAIAALGATISEVGAVIIVGGNIQGHDETLASALLEQFNFNNAGDQVAVAIGLVLLAMILVLIGALTVIQQRTDGIQLRFRAT
jgi:tungstate transport system permease protein